MQNENALKGLKVLDFSRVIAGPVTTRLLGSHGATVVRVESMASIDIMRVYIPMAKGVPGINRCGGFDAYNSDKYSLALNLRKPRGIEIAKRLVAWADIVIENFTPGVMERMGLGYDELKKVKPDSIMVSMSMQGQVGPHADQPGFGTELASLAGITYLIGWPDRSPAGTGLPYTDFIVPWLSIAAIIAALEYRDRTGRGQHTDISQLESGSLFLSPAVMDYLSNGRVESANGNRSTYAVPHGAYRCKGDDRWCAIGVFSDAEWRAFCAAIGNPAWASEEKFATFARRKENEDELDKLVEEWTCQYSDEEVMHRMQAAGIAAGLVADATDRSLDPQLRYRSHFVTLDHPEIGLHDYEAPSWRLSATPGELRMPSPCLGEHNEYVCKEILGMPDDEFVQLLNDGVLE